MAQVKEKEEEEKFPRAPRPRQGCRRLCDHQRQVPVVRFPVMMQRQVPIVHSFMLPVQFLDMVLDMPVVVLRQVPGLMVQKTVESPQLPSIYGRRHSLSFRRSRSPWSRRFTRPQRFSSCCSISGGRCPCCAGRAVSPVLPWRRSWRSHSCSSLRNRRPFFPDCSKLRTFRSCSSSTSSSTSLSCRKRRPSWSRLFSRPQSFHSCCTFQVIDVPCCAVEQVLRCCLLDDSQDPTVQLVVITVVVQRQIPWSRLFV